MDTAFAKIISDMAGRDHILIEGRIVSLVGDDVERNNEMVDAIVRGLRAAGNESVTGQIIGTAGRCVPNGAGEGWTN